MRLLPTASLTLALLLTGCGGAEPRERAEAPSPTPSAARPTTSPPDESRPAAEPATLPVFPARRAEALAAQVSEAERLLRAGRPGSAGFQRAAEFRQLAARALVVRGDAFARDVLGRLGARTARSLRPDVHAATLLHGMTDAQPRLPRWRIVQPPPAGALLRHYRAAEAQVGVPWEYLAAIHLVETRMGRIRGTSTAGAEGPMQFLPSTFAAYGEGGDINDPRDAIFAAARLLRANGAPGDLAGALWHYNHHDSYVQAVTSYARAMQRDPRAYRMYWHWRVLYKHESGAHVLPVGYPEKPAVRVR